MRLLRLSRYSNPLRILGRSLWRMRSELGTVFLLESIVLLIASALAYRIEQAAEPDTFRSIPDAMWWVLVTMTTVGYGDVVPVTELGRVLGVVVMVCGVALFAIPTGMIGASFVDEMNDERERARKLREKRLRKVAELKEERARDDAPVLVCPHCSKDVPLPDGLDSQVQRERS